MIMDLDKALNTFDQKWKLRPHLSFISVNKSVIWCDQESDSTAGEPEMSKRPRFSFSVDIDAYQLLLDCNANEVALENLNLSNNNNHIDETAAEDQQPQVAKPASLKRVSWAENLCDVTWIVDQKVNNVSNISQESGTTGDFVLQTNAEGL